MTVISTLPPAPARTDDQQTFTTKADALLGSLAEFVADTNTVAAEINANAVSANDAADDANTQAIIAQAAAATSTATANAAMFNASTTYQQGQSAISAINFQTYRRKTTGSSATDPFSDPTNWTPSLAGFGYGGSVGTGSVTLTSTSAGAQTITPTGPGKFVTLPDATTCQKTSLLFHLANAGEYDVVIKNAGGQVKGFIRPFQDVVVGLSDNSTANGVWELIGSQPYGITAHKDITTSLTNSALNPTQAVVIDSTRTLLLFGGSNLYGVIYDKSTQTWGTITTITTNNGGNNPKAKAVLVAANTVMVVWLTLSGGPLQSSTLTCTGTTITVNAAVSGPATGSSSGAWIIDLVPVGTGWVVQWYDAANGITRLSGITVSGTVPSIGTNVNTTTPQGSGSSLTVLSSTVVISIGCQSTSFQAQCFSLSGNTLTAGTESQIAPGSTCALHRVVVMPSGRIMAAWLRASSWVEITCLSISGTTITYTEITAAVPANITPTLWDWAVINSTKLLIAYTPGADPAVHYKVITDTSGTISASSDVNYSIDISTAVTGVAVLGVVGTSAKVFAYQANKSMLSYAEGSGASPVVTIQQRLAWENSGSVGYTYTAYPAGTDIKTQRPPAQLVSGNLTIIPPITSNKWGAIIGDRITFITDNPAVLGVGNAVGGTSRESWRIDVNGLSIQLLECIE